LFAKVLKFTDQVTAARQFIRASQRAELALDAAGQQRIDRLQNSRKPGDPSH